MRRSSGYLCRMISIFAVRCLNSIKPLLLTKVCVHVNYLRYPMGNLNHIIISFGYKFAIIATYMNGKQLTQQGLRSSCESVESAACFIRVQYLSVLQEDNKESFFDNLYSAIESHLEKIFSQLCYVPNDHDWQSR